MPAFFDIMTLMIIIYSLLAIAGILYGVLITYTPIQHPILTSVLSFARLFGAALLLYYLLQSTNILPILGIGVFVSSMWMWILIHTQRV